MNYYRSKINFTEGESNKCFIFSSRLSLADAINTAAMHEKLLKAQELIENPETTIEQILTGAAKKIISDIDEVKGIDIDPLDPDDIFFAKTKEVIPASLKHLLRLLCNGGNEHKILSIVTYSHNI